MFVLKSYKRLLEYVQRLRKELFEGEQHLWMRSNPFDDENYQCDFNGTKISLNEIFWGDESIKNGNIIIISGEKHIGKTFFCEWLLRECAESFEGENDNTVLNRLIQSDKYRIPVRITIDWLSRINRQELDLNSLIYKVISDSLASLDEREQRKLQVDIDTLLSKGKFVICFENNQWIQNEETLCRLLNYGKLYERYKSRTKYHNLVLLTSDVEGKIKDSFLNNRNCGYVALQLLSQGEVKAYLQNNNLNNLSQIAQENEDIMELMRHPEHLEMFETLCTKEMLQRQYDIKNKFELYEFFIRTHVKRVLSTKKVYEKARENSIYNSLRKYAWEKYVEKREGSLNNTKHFTIKDGRECGLLNENGEFSYIYCAYYLAADYLCEKLKRRDVKSLFPNTIREDLLERILTLASQMIEEIEEFSLLWNALADNSNYPLLLLAKVVKVNKSSDAFQEQLYEIAFKNLKSEFYDYSVLETFEELKPGCAKYLKAKYFLLSGYDEKEENNIKKRIIYYLGISHNGIQQRMIDELLRSDTDPHLKYHIIRAAVENYGENRETEEIIRNNIEKIKDYCYKEGDPIIKSDFNILHKKCTGKWWHEGREIQEIKDKLEKMLESEKYWVRAHAAGAIGRRKEHNACELLLTRIQKELNCIYQMNEGYPNSIKVISYSVEALCELYAALQQEEKDDLLKQFVKLIDMNVGRRNEYIDDAYSTIATGIECIICSNGESPAFNLGGRFRNRTSNHQRVLLYIMEELQQYYEDDEEMLELIKEKCQQLQNFPEQKEPHKDNRKRILHLSDWHHIEDNANNNVFFNKIEQYKPVDVLLITGDLKHYNGDYTRSLEVLRKIQGMLELDLEDIFLVPGNHDATDTIDDQEEIYKTIREKLWDNKEVYKEYLEQLYATFGTYGAFVRDFFGDDYYEHGGIHNKIFLWKNCLQILCMNTSLVCDQNSAEKKIVNTYELSKLKTQDTIPTIGISHHPYDEIHDAQKDFVCNIFKALNLSVLLSGDKHVSRNCTIGDRNRGISNWVIGKTYNEKGEKSVEHNIAIYDLDYSKKNIVPNVKKWHRDKYETDHEFTQTNPDNIEIPSSINLLYKDN